MLSTEQWNNPQDTNGANASKPMGVRYDRGEALDMFCHMPLGELMTLGYDARQQRLPGNRVTYVVDTNPNYTNICTTRCAFCAFYRKPEDPDAYLLTPEQIVNKVRTALAHGATTVLLQGGHHPDIYLEDWIAYIRAIREAFPNVHIHPFSPAEYVYMAEQENVHVHEILKAIYEEGVRTVPGGGAEILSERVRGIVAPGKASGAEWLETCEIAHGIGFKTTATMMYGHVESPEEIVDHLLRLRELQDRTGGFTSFIPWSFKPGGSRLGPSVRHAAHPAHYVRVIALARLVLDNFPHIQSSWFSENITAGQLGLMAGADDFGGVLIEENVLKDAGHDRAATTSNVKTIIRRAGFEPVQRDSLYRPL